MNKMQNKLKNTNFNFSKNIITSLIIPVAVCIVAVVLAIFVGFNKGIDFNGGILVSVVAENHNLEDSADYTAFTNEINTILNNNGVNGAVYMVETDSVTYNNVLVVKINYNGSESAKIVEALKSDIVSKFYSEVSESEIELRNLVNVSTFGSSVVGWKIMATILATVIVVIALSVYVALRTMSLHNAILTLCSSAISSVLAVALTIITRIQINAYSLAILPFVSILSSIVTFMYLTKTSEVLKQGNFDRKQNSVLANEAVKASINKFAFISASAVIVFLAVALINLANPVVHLGLLALVAVVAVAYVNIFVIPAIFALTFVRRVKKEKTKKEQKQEKLEEQEVLKETDLDNLVSN